jgi:hypothetical protein
MYPVLYSNKVEISIRFVDAYKKTLHSTRVKACKRPRLLNVTCCELRVSTALSHLHGVRDLSRGSSLPTYKLFREFPFFGYRTKCLLYR